ncbi:MAG: hypothetical protein V4488_06030 [Pseudomonadota bacterium]
MLLKTCLHCGQEFSSSLGLYCMHCQSGASMPSAGSGRQQNENDPDYRDNQTCVQKAWREHHPEYCANCRANHHEYSAQTPVPAKIENRGGRQLGIGFGQHYIENLTLWQ